MMGDFSSNVSTSEDAMSVSTSSTQDSPSPPASIMNSNSSSTNNNATKTTNLELIIKASGLDPSRIGACLFCQEFWMELYALFELGIVRLEVKTVNVNSEAFKRSFSGSQPPILIENDKNTSYTDNRDIEGRIFHIAKDHSIPLFEKDGRVEKNIESLFRNFKMFLRCKADSDRMNGGNVAESSSTASVMPPSVQPSHNKLMENLYNINSLLAERGSRYLLGSSMTEYDCELMPRLHHIRVGGGALAGLVLPSELTYLWNYILTAYRTAGFIESCPFDQDIIHHYKEQLNLKSRQRMGLERPVHTRDIPSTTLDEIKRLGLDQ